MSRRTLAALAVFSLFAAPARPQFTAQELKAAQLEPKRYIIDERTVKVERLGPPTAAEPAPLRGAPGVTDIVNTGLDVWKIIVANKPVVNVATQFATALPKGVKAWPEMEGWKGPIGTQYHLSAKNLYGATVIDVNYQVVRTYGGDYRGKGRYLTAVTVAALPDGISVLMGYHFYLTTTVPDSGIVNVGTAADPVAGMMVQTAWRISTPLKDAQGQRTYFVQGDGAIREIGGPAEAPKTARASAASASSAAWRFE